MYLIFTFQIANQSHIRCLVIPKKQFSLCHLVYVKSDIMYHVNILFGIPSNMSHKYLVQ